MAADKFDEPGRIGEPVLAKDDRRAAGPGVELLNAGDPARRLDLDDIQQMFDLAREVAEPIDQFSAERVDFARGF